MSSRSWIPYAALLVVFWGVWGAFSSLPADEYGYPDEMIYILWSLTMLIPAYFILRSEGTFDRRPIAAPLSTATLSRETDLDALSDDLVTVVKGTMQPTYVSLWLRSGTNAKGEHR